MPDYINLHSTISRDTLINGDFIQTDTTCMEQTQTAGSDITIFLEPMIAVLNAFVRK